jgi:hypothetical protein
LYRRIEREKERRLKGESAARPETTSIIMEALDAFLSAIEKKVKQSIGTQE